MKLLCLGDSNTFGHDPRSFPGGRYPKTVRWTGLLEGAGYTVANHGQNGLEIPEGAARLSVFARLVLSELPANLVTVMLGGNDLLQHPDFKAEDVVSRMEGFLLRLKQETPETPFLLIAPPPMREGTWVTQAQLIRESERLAEGYAHLAACLGVSFADAGAWKIPLCFDGVHFSEEGHARFAEGLLRTLREGPCGSL